MTCLSKAYKLYKAKDENLNTGQQSCIHGMALAVFHMAYLYQTYAAELKQLAKIKKFNKKSGSTNSSMIDSLKRPYSTNDVDREKGYCIEFAYQYYKKAYGLFWLINHLKGCMITAERILAMNPEEHLKAKYTENLHECTHAYEDYIHHKGENPFLLRKQGEI